MKCKKLFIPNCRCFKREFTEAVAIRMWEACWSNYLTDYFHLFLCLAIIAVYADDVVAQDLCTDEMLLHFSSLGEKTAHHMNMFSYRQTECFYFIKNPFSSNVYGWTIDFTQGTRSFISISATAKNPMHPIKFVQTMWAWNLGNSSSPSY